MNPLSYILTLTILTGCTTTTTPPRLAWSSGCNSKKCAHEMTMLAPTEEQRAEQESVDKARAEAKAVSDKEQARQREERIRANREEERARLAAWDREHPHHKEIFTPYVPGQGKFGPVQLPDRRQPLNFFGCPEDSLPGPGTGQCGYWSVIPGPRVTE